MLKWLQIEFLKLKSLIEKDTTILAVDVVSKSTMSFKNGSIVETLPLKELDSNSVIRGKRSKYIEAYEDYCGYSKEELDNILKPIIRSKKVND